MTKEKEGIIINSNDVIIGRFSNTKKAHLSMLKALMNNKHVVKNDPKIKYESRVVLIISSTKNNDFDFQNKLQLTGNYESLGDHHNLKAEEECEYYQETLFDSGKFTKAVRVLQKDLFSKKSFIDLNENPKPSNGKIPCLIYLSFRFVNGKLDLHAHMRANNGYLLSKINMDVNRAVHQKAAHLLRVPIGQYYHIADSMHIYHKDYAKAKLMAQNAF